MGSVRTSRQPPADRVHTSNVASGAVLGAASSGRRTQMYSPRPPSRLPAGSKNGGSPPWRRVATASAVSGPAGVANTAAAATRVSSAKCSTSSVLLGGRSGNSWPAGPASQANGSWWQNSTSGTGRAWTGQANSPSRYRAFTGMPSPVTATSRRANAGSASAIARISRRAGWVMVDSTSRLRCRGFARAEARIASAAAASSAFGRLNPPMLKRMRWVLGCTRLPRADRNQRCRSRLNGSSSHTGQKATGGSGPPSGRRSGRSQTKSVTAAAICRLVKQNRKVRSSYTSMSGWWSSSPSTSSAVAVVMNRSGFGPFQQSWAANAFARSAARSLDPPPTRASGGGSRSASARTQSAVVRSLDSLYHRTRSLAGRPTRPMTTSGTATVLSLNAADASTVRPGSRAGARNMPATNRSQVVPLVVVCR